MFFVADELYLKAGYELPPEDYYEGYPQIENGVGMLRSFEEEFGIAYGDILDMPRDICREVSVATGAASYPMISRLAARLSEIFPKLKINVYKIINRFYGESITVSGLLTGRDISEQLCDKPLGEMLFIPENALRSEGDLFLCGMSVSELSEKLSVPVGISENDGYEFVRALLGAE